MARRYAPKSTLPRRLRTATLQARPRERFVALARVFGRDLRDDLADGGADAVVVFGEHLEDVFGGHGPEVEVALEADVVVGDESDVDVAHLELTREIGFGILRHVDDVAADRREEARFRAGREARAVDDDDRTGV